MSTNALPFACKSCGHKWTEPMPLPMWLHSFISKMRGIKCPCCDNGGRSLMIMFGARQPDDVGMGAEPEVRTVEFR